MKTREEYIALITSHAEELKKNFDIRKHHHLNPFLLKEVEKDGIEVIAEG